MSTEKSTANAVKTSIKAFRVSKIFLALVVLIACYTFYKEANDFRLAWNPYYVDGRTHKTYDNTNGNVTHITIGTFNKLTTSSGTEFRGKYKGPKEEKEKLIEQTTQKNNISLDSAEIPVELRRIEPQVTKKSTTSLETEFRGKYKDPKEEIHRSVKQTTYKNNGSLKSTDFPVELRRMEPQIFKFVGQKRLPNFKNPCWYHNLSPKTLQCVPYFFLLGVTKCGTSDVWEKLNCHPQIVRAAGKESHWWTQRRYDKRSTFSLELRRGTRGLDLPTKKNLNSSKMVIGDGSPSTFWDNHNWRSHFPGNKKGPPYVVADLIHAVDPDAKLIVILRDPVSRMYSSYNFFKGKHVSPEEFHQKVLERIQIFQRCLSVNSLRACAYQDIVNFHPKNRDNSMMQLRIGIYHVFLEDWLRVFPRNQLFILELEDWNNRCTEILPELFEFLNLERLSDMSIKLSCLKPPRNKAKFEVKPMLPETKKILEKFYQPYNLRLNEMLQDSRFNWTYLV